MMNLNGDERATKVEPALSEMLDDIKDAHDGVCFADDLINYIDTDSDEMVDPVETRELFVKSSCLVDDLFRCVCKYAGYVRAYQEILNDCGIDIEKRVGPKEFADRSRKICESLKMAAMDTPANDGVKQCD